MLAELFLQDLAPVFVTRASDGTPFDYLLGLRNSNGGVNITAVEVKAKAQAPAALHPVSRKAFDRLAYSNVLGLILVVDVKHNKLFFGCPSADDDASGTGARVLVELSEVNDDSVKSLRDRLAGVAPVGASRRTGAMRHG